MAHFAKVLLLVLVATTSFVKGYQDYYRLYGKVQELIENTCRYIFPDNNDEFYAFNKVSPETCVTGEYDFIIVGAGTAGGVLANRLTEIKEFNVLVLEAGGETPELSDMLGINIFLYQTPYNWGYKTTRQENMCWGSRDGRCAYPRGKTLGGSSAINFGMYVRGHHDDYNHWEELGNPGWSYADVLPYFKKAETATFKHNIDRAYHGFKGPQKIGIPNDTPYLTQALVDCHIELGKRETDYNGANQNGVSRSQFFLDGNIRSSSNHAFIQPARNRPNLHISIHSYVTQILIKKKTAYGVRYVKNGVECVATARKEVILSAGSINSPHLLMLSGIGPKEELRKHDIKVIKDLPVGKFMQDHQYFPGIFYRTNRHFYTTTRLENVKLWTRNLRPLTSSLGQQTISFWNFMGLEESQPEIEFFIFGPPAVTPDDAVLLGYTDEYLKIFESLNKYTDFSFNIVLLHPRSQGSVTLKSKDPRDFPIINPNYFSDPEGIDLENMYKGVQIALKFNDTETFRNFHAELYMLPYPNCDKKYERLSKKWWYCVIKTLSITFVHPVSTTRMGPDPRTSVVNAELKVHGIKHLRVVDSGIMPDHISGHPQAAEVMIAEKIADSIKLEHL